MGNRHCNAAGKMLATLLVSAAFLYADGLAAETWQRQFAENPGDGKIAYYTLSASPDTVPLLVISGGPGSDHRYMHAAGAFEALAAERRVVMYDQRATGASAPAPEEPTIDLWLEDIEAIRRALGTERLDLLGHSFGGYLAMSYATSRPRHTRSLVLVDSAAPALDENVQLLGQVYPERAARWQSLRQGLPTRFPATDIEVFFSMEFVDPGWLDRFVGHVESLTYDIGVNDALRADMNRRDLAAQVSGIERPVLVLHGRFDSVLAPVNSWNIHKTIPGSRFHIIEQSGHMPFIERRDEFNDVVRGFLAGLDGE